MKNKISLAEKMQQNLFPSSEDKLLSGLEKLNSAAQLAENLNLISLAETITKLTEQYVHKQS